LNTSEKPNFSRKNSHDLWISVTNSCGSALTIVALDREDFTLSDVVESPVFRACQLSKPCCLATISCAYPRQEQPITVATSTVSRVVLGRADLNVRAGSQFVACRRHDLLPLFEISEHLSFSASCSAGLYVHPLRFLFTNPDHKRALQVCGDRRGWNE